MHERVEALLVAAIALAVSLLLGFVVEALRHPITLVTVAAAAGAGWWFRREIQSRPLAVLVVAVSVGVVAVLFLVSPSYLVRVWPR